MVQTENEEWSRLVVTDYTRRYAKLRIEIRALYEVVRTWSDTENTTTRTTALMLTFSVLSVYTTLGLT